MPEYTKFINVMQYTETVYLKDGEEIARERNYDDHSYDAYIEDKPSPAEQYKALEPGTIFVKRPDSTYKYLKISDEKYYSVTLGRVWNVSPNEFPADLYVVEEQ